MFQLYNTSHWLWFRFRLLPLALGSLFSEVTSEDLLYTAMHVLLVHSVWSAHNQNRVCIILDTGFHAHIQTSAHDLSKNPTMWACEGIELCPHLVQERGRLNIRIAIIAQQGPPLRLEGLHLKLRTRATESTFLVSSHSFHLFCLQPSLCRHS